MNKIKITKFEKYILINILNHINMQLNTIEGDARQFKEHRL